MSIRNKLFRLRLRWNDFRSFRYNIFRYARYRRAVREYMSIAGLLDMPLHPTDTYYEELDK